ncbi:hypothetical protein [Niabella hibiscisoli]|uniref:hypothetical protein n=1 Tax=Niabella hibiscisoli TaxID=1825928 RepID=UPI001F0D57BA|nr:hypothetical protein [Niabella hibiscisoli]MCH5715356.1 hypothetical protein [Niabella hibiscisoli]
MNYTAIPPNTTFNEAEWLRVLFLLSDTEQWLQQQHTQHFYQLPLKQHKKLLRSSWYLSPAALAHIIERHYYKISRHPCAGKFTINIPELVAYIREAFTVAPTPVPDSVNLQRTLTTATPIGFDNQGNTVAALTIISNAGGRIITAFPGFIYSPL